MYLKPRKTVKVTPRRQTRRDTSGGAVPLLIYTLLFCVFGATLFGAFALMTYLNSEAEKLNRRIEKEHADLKSSNLEIRNLNLKIETRSRKQFILSKIDRYQMNLRPPAANQVVYLDAGGQRVNDRDRGHYRVAYNGKREQPVRSATEAGKF